MSSNRADIRRFDHSVLMVWVNLAESACSINRTKLVLQADILGYKTKCLFSKYLINIVDGCMFKTKKERVRLKWPCDGSKSVIDV